MRRSSSAVLVRWVIVSVLVLLGPAVGAAIQAINLKVVASNGKPAANLPVTIVNTDETGGTLGSTDDEGDIAMAADSSKNGKRYNVYKVSCSRIVFAEEGSREDNRCKNDKGSEPTGCRSCEPLGFFIFGTDATIGTLSSGGTDGIRIGAFANAGAKGTTIANAGDTVATIDGRFSSANPAYNVPRQIDISDQAWGAGAGGGVQLAWSPRFGTRMGFFWEGEREVPTQDVRGTRDSGGVIFEQQGSTALSSVSFTVGPTVQFGSILISGGAALTRWNADFTQTGSLRAGCPALCQTVRIDNNTTTAEGTDVGYFAGVDWYPGNRWLGLSATYTFMNFKGVYQPTAALGWPENWTDHNFFFGATFRTPNLIR